MDRIGLRYTCWRAVRHPNLHFGIGVWADAEPGSSASRPRESTPVLGMPFESHTELMSKVRQLLCVLTARHLHWQTSPINMETRTAGPRFQLKTFRSSQRPFAGNHDRANATCGMHDIIARRREGLSIDSRQGTRRRPPARRGRGGRSGVGSSQRPLWIRGWLRFRPRCASRHELSEEASRGFSSI